MARMARDELEHIVDIRIFVVEFDGVGRRDSDHHECGRKQESSPAAVDRLEGKAAASVRLLP